LYLAISIFVIALVLFATGYWWRYRSLACPASLFWLVENPYMNAVAGAEKILQRLRIEEGMRLLDVGSGPGRLTLPAANRVGKAEEVVAMDIQAKMLEKLRLRKEDIGLDNIRTIQAQTRFVHYAVKRVFMKWSLLETGFLLQ